MKKNIAMHETHDYLRNEAEFNQEIVKLKRMRDSHKNLRNERKRALQNYRESVTKRVKT